MEYVYIYMYVCVCVCVCVYLTVERQEASKYFWW